MKKFSCVFFIFILTVFLSISNYKIDKLFASPNLALNESVLAEKLLIKLQNIDYSQENIELETLYKHFEILCHENTQFYSYKIIEIEKLMNEYRNFIIKSARLLAEKHEYKHAVEYLESKSEIFKDKTSINSLISHYSKFFIKDGLFFCKTAPKIISINKLIAYPNFAFNDNINSSTYDKLYLTSNEFYNLLNELYLNDYILINLTDYIDIENETTTKKDLYIPQNKKPVILIFNDINFSENETSFIEKYIIDSKNEIACFSSKQVEKNQISYSTDFIPILENFINQYKGFSFNNAKSVITFNNTGSILGYNINKTNPNYNQEILNLKKIGSFLKEKGYIFGYSSNFDNKNSENELDFIQNEIFSIFGNLKIHFSNILDNKIYPFYYDLNKLGFKIFITLGDNTCFVKNNLALISSLKIDGNFLRNPLSLLKLNYEKIYDHANRPSVFKT